MSSRLSYPAVAPDALKALLTFGGYVAKSSLDPKLVELVNLRASQINGCAFCLAMHSAALREHGETNNRIDLVSVWREMTFYTSRERAALAWTEAVTELTNREVPEDVYQEALAEFGEKDLVDLTIAITQINTWNRLNVAFHQPPAHVS